MIEAFLGDVKQRAISFRRKASVNAYPLIPTYSWHNPHVIEFYTRIFQSMRVRFGRVSYNKCFSCLHGILAMISISVYCWLISSLRARTDHVPPRNDFSILCHWTDQISTCSGPSIFWAKTTHLGLHFSRNCMYIGDTSTNIPSSFMDELSSLYSNRIIWDHMLRSV